MNKHKNENTLVPKLRFPEFTDFWKTEQLSNLLDYERPDSYIVKDTNYISDGTPVLTANKSFILGYTQETFGICNDIPAIIFDDFTVDKKFVNFPFKVKSSAIKILRPKGKNDLKFIFELMSLIRFEAKEHKRYYISAYQNITVPIPLPQEQQKIAATLSSLDDLINAEGQKLDVLKAHKKGLLQHLFPQEGETVPRMRFKEFEDSGEWEIKELNELGFLINGLTYSPEDVRDKGLLVLRSSNIQYGIIDLKDCVYVKEDIKGANLIETKDILVCVRNGSKNLIGKNAIIPDDIPFATHGAFMTVFRANNPDFVYQLFQTDYYDKQVKADLGATINSINGRNFIKYEFPVPKKPKEQQKIASALSSIDELITAQSQRIEALQVHKKGLLQGLFPDLNEVTA